MYVLGKSGTGKSVLLENMIIQNIHQGEGVCVVDPHGELVEKILETIPRERINDVVYFNPADTDHNIGFNVLQLDDPRYKHLVASGLMGIFTKIWANAWSSRMEYILNNTILALLDTPDTTLLGIPRMLVDKDYRQYIINNLKDPVVKAFWVHEYEAWRDQFRNEAIAPIQNKVGQFLSSNIVRNVVGQTRSTINIFDIMNSKKIFLVNVSKGRIGEDNSALLGGMLITKLQLSAMERVRIPENQREDFYLYVDEFQNFVTDSFASILSEARKYRLNLIIAHQYIAQLETADSKTVKDAVFGNVGTMIIFRVGADDADALEKEFEPEFMVEDFVNLPNYHIYTKLMVDGVTSRPFSARTLPPVQVESSDEIRQLVIDASRTNYTRQRTVVEAEIQKWSSTVPGQTRPDGEETEGKFRAECTNCHKAIYVPFEPEPGRPIYCKECLFKIKNGELEPVAGFRPPKEKRENISYDALANLGIEFKNEARPSGPPARFDRTMAPRPFKPQPPATPAQPTASFTPRPPQVKVEREDGPPQGMIRADVRDMPIPRTPRPQPAADQKPAGDMTVPSPRVVRAPIRKERRGPDTGALQSLLKDALGGVIKKAPNPEPVPVQQTAVKSEVPQPALSLGALKQKNPQQFVIPNKEAQPERQSMLQDAISKAIGEQPPVSETLKVPEEKPLEPNIEEEKRKKELAEAQEIARKAKEAEEKMAREMEAERKRLADLEEARKKAIEEIEARQKREREEAEKEQERLKEELRQQAIRAEEAEALRKREEESRRLEEENRKKAEEEQRAREEAARKQQEAEARAKAERELQEKREREEKLERERIEQELREKEAREQAEKEAALKSIEEPKPEKSEDASTLVKKAKEIPEDLLKQILE